MLRQASFSHHLSMRSWATENFVRAFTALSSWLSLTWIKTGRNAACSGQHSPSTQPFPLQPGAVRLRSPGNKYVLARASVARRGTTHQKPKRPLSGGYPQLHNTAQTKPPACELCDTGCETLTLCLQRPSAPPQPLKHCEASNRFIGCLQRPRLPCKDHTVPADFRLDVGL